MNDVIINGIVNDLGIKKDSVIATLKLLGEGATIPFIARYRKEVTGALDEEQIRSINEVYEYQENLLKRKDAVSNETASFSYACFLILPVRI